MLWLGWYFPWLPLECWSDAAQVPLAVTCTRGGRERIDRCNAVAAAAGVVPGMTLAEALALLPGLQAHPRDKVREAEVLEVLGGWAWRYSARITFDPLLVLLEVGGSLRLFGGFEALRTRMADELETLGHQGQWALAPTPSAAALLARTRPGSWVASLAELQRRLSPLPLRRLTRDPAWLRLMEGVGLSRIGDCLQLPRPELARRVGAASMQRLDRLLGRAPDPRPLWRPQERFRRRLLLAAEIEQAAALCFPARRLLEALCAFLRGRDAAVQQLRWWLWHRSGAPTGFEQSLQAPTRDPAHLLELLRQRLERLTLPSPVLEIGLEADHWHPLQPCQADLFRQETEDAGSVLERLQARLGQDAVQGLKLLADHCPERASDTCAPGQGGGAEITPAQRRQPLWLLPRPQPLHQRNGVPLHGGPLHLSPWVERIESGWWDEATACARDYYRAVDASGRRWWVFRERRSGRWFLHGRFD